MKKRFLLVLVMMIGAHLFAQNFEFKDYTDYSQDFRGAAGSYYVDQLDEEQMDIVYEAFSKALESLREVKKLTKRDAWLLKKAMNEWDYQKGEAYFVCVANSKYAENGILFLVYVNDYSRYIWRGWEITTSDLVNLGEKFN